MFCRVLCLIVVFSGSVQHCDSQVEGEAAWTYYINTPIQSKKENFLIKHSDIFHISVQNRVWVLVRTARQGGSNEYHNLCFFQQNKKKIMYTQ